MRCERGMPKLASSTTKLNGAITLGVLITKATKTMSPSEHRQLAIELLAASDEAFEQDEVVEGALKLGEAAAHAVTAAAVARGWPVGERRLLKFAAERLAKEIGDPSIAGAYAGAEEFSRHRSRDWMEDWQRDADRPLVHDFVRRLLVL